MEEIRLTSEELEAIKDNVRFRENITLRLKILESKIDKLNGYEQKLEKMGSSINSYKNWKEIHTWLIGIIFIVLGWLIHKK